MMKTLKKVAILGLDAIRTYFASRFLMTPGISTLVMATASQYEQLNKPALWSTFRIPVSLPQ
ncbi:MAG: hypothetical protein J7K90_04765 [Desulfuromusa sp.]|nr:hypothetical protein [Desulfuromusa sp.]